MLSLLLASFVTFFVAIDPVAMAPMFTTMTAQMAPAWRRTMAWKSIAIATGILLAFAFGGAWLLEHLGVSIDAFRIAGGLLLFLIAVDMLFEKRSERREERAEEVAAQQAQHPDAIERALILSGMAMNLILCLIAFLLAEPLSKFMRQTVSSMLTRIFG